MTPTVLEAINQQVSNEFSAWLRLQSAEEHAHGMRLFNFLLARNHQAKLLGIQAPRADFSSLLEVFEQALAQEQSVSGQIDRLYELAFSEKVFAAMAELQWFITEQVEEEKTVREIVAKLRMVSHDAASVLDVDRELGARPAGAAGA
jgi:ferritin